MSDQQATTSATEAEKWQDKSQGMEEGATVVNAAEEDVEDEEDDYMAGGLEFVFQDWLDPQTFTCHSADTFSLLDVEVQQGTFCHTKENDQTGAVVWDDAVMLARHMVNKFGKELQGQRVVDLGAGTGFLGLTVARGCGANVAITDRDVMKDLIERNIDLNKDGITQQGGNASFFDHSWGEDLDPEMAKMLPFHVVLCSGCIYHEEANPALLKSLRVLSGCTGDIYVAIDFRFDVTIQAEDEQYAAPVVASFLEQAQEAGLDLQELSAEGGELVLEPSQVKKSVKIFKGHFIN